MPGIGLKRPNPASSPVRTLDTGHPLASGLLFLVTPGSVPGRPGGSGLSWSAGPTGRVMQTGGSSALAFPVPRLPTMLNWTMHTVVRFTGSDIYAPIFGMPANPQSGSWSSPYHASTLGRESNGSAMFLGTNASGSYNSSGAVGSGIWVSDGLWHSYTATMGGSGIILYKDGLQVATSSATPSGSGNPTTPTINGTPEVVMGGRSASTPTGEHFTGGCALQALWTRRLSPSEVAMMHARPFEMFGG